MTPLLILLVAATDPFAIFPNVTISYYDVGGTDATAILASIEAKRPHDPADNKPYEALTSVHISWKWKGREGGCDLKSTRIDFSGTVTMPRLMMFDALTPELRAKWSAYSEALAAHEAGHLKIAMDYLPKVKAAIARATCKTANAAGRAVLKQMNARNIAYDVETRHGAATGANLSDALPTPASAPVKQ